MGAGAFIGALVGGMAGSMTKPHYEDIQTGGANRTAVYADVASGQATVGAAIGALLGGLLGSLKTTDASA